MPKTAPIMAKLTES